MKLHLHSIMEEKGYTVQRLSEESGFSRANLIKFWKEKEVPKFVKMETLETLSKTLNVELYDLISFDTPKEIEFKISKFENTRTSYVPLRAEINDNFYIKVETNTNKYYLLLINVKYSFDDFLSNFSKEIGEMEKIISTRSNDDEDKLRFDLLFNSLIDELKRYTGRKTFNQRSFHVRNFGFEKGYKILENEVEWTTEVNMLFKNSSSLSEIIGNNSFLKIICDYFVHYYDLENQNLVKDNINISINSATGEKDPRVIKSDSINFNFFYEDELTKKEIVYKLKSTKK